MGDGKRDAENMPSEGSGRALIHALHGITPNDPPCSPPCDREYCAGCAMLECPHREPLHRHHDGCPACAERGQVAETVGGLHQFGPIVNGVSVCKLCRLEYTKWWWDPVGRANCQGQDSAGSVDAAHRETADDAPVASKEPSGAGLRTSTQPAEVSAGDVDLGHLRALSDKWIKKETNDPGWARVPAGVAGGALKEALDVIAALAPIVKAAVEFEAIDKRLWEATPDTWSEGLIQTKESANWALIEAVRNCPPEFLAE